jgi:tetratricopeptide (TPR) repeat protein
MAHGLLERGLAALEAGDLLLARQVIRQALDARPEDGATLYAAGRLALALRRPAEAAALFGRAVSQVDTAEVWNDLGRALNNARRPGEAEAAFRRAIELRPGDAALHNRLGHVLRSRNRIDEALQAFEQAVRLDPGLAAGWRNLGGARLSGDDANGALEAFRRALALDPENPRNRALLAAAAHRTGDLPGAIAAYRALLAEHPDESDAWANLGMALQDSGDLVAAVDAYETALARAPEDLSTRNRLGDALLAAGRHAEALRVGDETLAADPGNPAAIATRALALAGLKRVEESAELLAMDRLIRAFPLAPPRGYADMAAFNRELAGFVTAHPSLRREPAGHATRLGSHTRDLLGEAPGPVGHLEAAARRAVAHYLEAVVPPSGHPFPGPRPTQHELVMWAVVMDRLGHQLPHIHPAAWLSGVYYAELPDDVAETGEEGWIEFGHPPEELATGCLPPRRRIRPEEGTLILFPSFLYHRTVPFTTGRRRISIALDVLRRPRG